MKRATSPEQQCRWMEQWRRSAIALAELKRYDLQSFTGEEAWRRIEAIQSVREVWRDPEKASELIAQQALFQKLR